MQVLSVNRSRSQTGFTHEIDEALADEAEAAYDRCTAAATPFERPSLGLSTLAGAAARTKIQQRLCAVRSPLGQHGYHLSRLPRCRRKSVLMLADEASLT